VEARRKIGYLPENAPSYGDMTVEEFLRFIAEVRGYSGGERHQRVEQAIEKSFLQSVRRQTIDTLSKGYRQRTCFAQAILHDPPVLIMDEPTDGLDPNQKHVVRNMIRKMAEEKVIVLSTHVLEEVEAICNRVLIISAGKLVTDSTPDELRRRSRTFNAVTMWLEAPLEEARAGFKGLSDVDTVEAEPADGNQVLCRIYPRGGKPVAAPLLETAREKGWLVTHIETDSGRLDDVFRDLTTTEDVTDAAQKEEA
jgi:ABC-2 type transport system ATP-binding protein